MRSLLEDQPRRTGVPRINRRDLVAITVVGQIADPLSRRSPYRIGRDGQPRLLPGSGGIVLNFRVGDRCVGLAADHVEPGVSVRNEGGVATDGKDQANLALNTYACIGNSAVVVDGPCAGAKGVVTGKHGGVNNVLVDYPRQVLRRLRNGDRIQICAYGLGLRFLDLPQITALNCSPRLIRHWGLIRDGARLQVPVTHLIPAAVMGSGLGRNNAVRGDYDIQLFDSKVVRRFRLDRLRFGDLVAIANADSRYGRAFHSGFMTIGIVVHSDSTVSGHGPGVASLLSAEARFLVPVRDDRANLTAILGIRRLPVARPQATLQAKEALALRRLERRRLEQRRLQTAA